MNLIKTALAAAVSMAAVSPVAWSCTSVVVGKGVSATGSIIISRNEDSVANNWTKHLVTYPEKNRRKSDKVTLSNGLVVSAPGKTFRYTAMPDWNRFSYLTPDEGKAYEERGVNEKNVAMSATNSVEINKKALRADPLVEKGIIEQNITGLILGQATSAHHAAWLLGAYVSKYGAGEGYGVQFADQSEAWYMEVGSGHQWIAIRIPDDKYLVVANGLRIHGVDLDSKDVMSSRGLFEMVRKNGLLKDPMRNDFNFAKAFGVTGDHYNTDREWLGQKMLSPSVTQETGMIQYPLFLTPDKKVGVADIARVLRADYRGTKLEGKAERTIGVDRNSEAHIIEMYPDMPGQLAAVIWQTPSCVKYSPFIPVYNVMKDIPVRYTWGSDHYDTGSAWWTFRAVGSLSSEGVYGGKYRKLVDTFRDKVEQQFIGAQPYVNTMLKKMYEKDQNMAMNFASDYSNGLLQTALEKFRTLRSVLMTDLTRSTEKKYSAKEFEKISHL